MTETDAAENLVGEIAEIWAGKLPQNAGQLWRSLWTLASTAAKTHLIAAAREQDAEHPETAGRMPWAGDVAAWRDEQRAEVSR